MQRTAVFWTLCLTAALAGPARAQGPIGKIVGPGCTLFEHIDFGGAKFEIRGNYDLSWIGDEWNDKVSSLVCEPGCRLTVYEDAEFGGASRTYTSRVAWIGHAWNDRISSAKLRCR